MVVFVHLTPLLAHAGLSFDVGFCRGGVDLFFIISGFIMQRICDDTRPSPLRFGRNRLKRVLPVYYLGTVMFFAVAQVIAPRGIQAGPTQLLMSLMFLPQGTAPFYPLLFVGWTLNFEIYFYALCCALLALQIQGAARVAAMAALLAVPVGLHLAGLLGSGPVSFYGDPIVFEFVIGMALALIYTRLIKVPSVVAWTTALLGTIGLIVGDRWAPFTRLFYYGLPAALIVFAALTLERRAVRTKSIWWLRFGAISYSLYIMHPLVLSAFYKVAQRVVEPGSLAAYMFVAGAAFAALAFAYLVHLFFELPLAGALRGAKGVSLALDEDRARAAIKG